MAEIGSRIQSAIEELTGNEALLEMLDEDAASEMLKWGVKMSTSIVEQTDGLDDLFATIQLVPRLKAVRQSMRSVGNWAVGKYVDPQSRIQLRDKLLEQFRIILGENAQLPSSAEFDELLNQVDDKSNTPHQLIVKLIQLIASKISGEEE